MSEYRDFILQTITNTPGVSGALVLGPAVAGMLGFVAGDNGKTFDVRITQAGLGSESRKDCVYTHSTTTLTRGTLESSTTGAAISFTSAATVSSVVLASTVQALVSGAGDRGIFADTTALQAAFPAAASAGWTASVGASAPYAQYYSNGTAWGIVAGSSTAVTPTNNMFFGNSVPPIASSAVIGNTSAGKGALALLTTGNSNTAIGDGAGAKLDGAGADGNTVAALNTLVGANSGWSLTTGTANVFIGQKSGTQTTTGNGNVYIGKSTGDLATIGSNNVCIGGAKGTFSGSGNVALGALSGQNQSGADNVLIGYSAGGSFTGSRNVAIGRDAANSATTGTEDVYVGAFAGASITTQYGNVFLGGRCGNNSTSSEATYIGCNAGLSATGNGNVAIGYAAGQSVTSGTDCTFIGQRAGNGSTTFSNVLGIGAHAGRYASAAGQVFIDSRNRTNIAGAQDIGIVYGKTETTAAAQVLHLNAQTRIGAGDAPVVAGLPAAAAGFKGYRGYVTDATVAYASANVGSTVAGGGSNCVPVFCTGAAWVVG